jgi:lysophospholipase L1-like esterase
LGLLLVSNGAFAQTSTPVFSDDFNRPDTTIADNGWVMKTARANIFSISNNQLVLSNGVVGATHSAYNITRPRSTAHLNQSASVDIIAGTPTTSEAGLLLRTNQAASDYVVVYLRANTFGIYDASSFLQNPTVSRDSSHSYRIIATIESTSELSSTITAKLIDLGVDGNSTIELKNITAIDTVLARQMSGSIGLFYNDRGTGGGIAIFDNFSGTTVSETVVYEPLSMNIDSPTVQFGTPINITISGDEDVVVTLQDTASGSFSSNSISLNNENAYTANVTYTPTKLGNITITATASDETLLTQEIFVSPYATVIGFIGDSITHGWGMSSTGLWAQNIAAKSLGMTAIDGAIGGATSSSWANNNVGSMYINAKTAFQATDVDIVHLMIGTNDCGTITPEKYKNYLQTLVDNLKIDGFKHLLISQPPYRNSNETCLDNLLGYQTAISTLVVENGGFVLLGDMTAYNVFENEYASLMGSDPHPNTAGQNRLGQLWAAAIKSVIDYQINPAHQFTGINGTSYTL